jgi:hypothetical protein
VALCVRRKYRPSSLYPSAVSSAEPESAAAKETRTAYGTRRVQSPINLKASREPKRIVTWLSSTAGRPLRVLAYATSALTASSGVPSRTQLADARTGCTTLASLAQTTPYEASFPRSNQPNLSPNPQCAPIRAVPAVSVRRRADRENLAVRHAPDAPKPGKSQRRGRNAAHCPGCPPQRQRCFASRKRDAPLTPEPLPAKRA